MPAADLASAAAAPAASAAAPKFRQFPVALRFALRNQSRNRLAWLLLVVFVPAWYLLMQAITGHTTLTFRLFATGRVLVVDGGHLTLISAGLNSVTIIVGFAIVAIAIVAVAVAVFTSLVLLAFWRPGLPGWLAIGAAFTVIALGYGAFGLFLGVLVRSDLEGFSLIIMGGLMDTFLQNPLGNPLAGKPVLEWFPPSAPPSSRWAARSATPRSGGTWPSAWPGPPPSPPQAWPSSGSGPAPACTPAETRAGPGKAGGRFPDRRAGYLADREPCPHRRDGYYLKGAACGLAQASSYSTSTRPCRT
jgi:ABC-2 type transport system permease protein